MVKLARGPVSNSQYPRFKWTMLYHATLTLFKQQNVTCGSTSPHLQPVLSVYCWQFPNKGNAGQENSFTATRCLGSGGAAQVWGGHCLRQTLMARTHLPSWGTEERPLWVSSQESVEAPGVEVQSWRNLDMFRRR